MTLTTPVIRWTCTPSANQWRSSPTGSETDKMPQDIADFHEKFGLEMPKRPSALSAEMLQFRIKFLQEELDEYIKSSEEGDLEGQFDALIDLVYVAMGTAYLQGFPWKEGWDEVQRANISKERATTAGQSKRGTSLDVIKPPGWIPPDIGFILARASL